MTLTILAKKQTNDQQFFRGFRTKVLAWSSNNPKQTFSISRFTLQTDKNGCAKFLPKMLVFTKTDAKVFQNLVYITASAQEEGTGKFYHSFTALAGCWIAVTWMLFLIGIVLSNKKVVELSYVIGKLSFVDTPKFYKEGSMFEGKVGKKRWVFKAIRV